MQFVLTFNQPLAHTERIEDPAQGPALLAPWMTYMKQMQDAGVMRGGERLAPPWTASTVRVRDGHTGARKAGDIGFATLRGGTVIGDHSVILAGPGESITLSHHAADREIFARGAIRAALWAHGKKPGLYSMRDVLGLSAA